MPRYTKNRTRFLHSIELRMNDDHLTKLAALRTYFQLTGEYWRPTTIRACIDDCYARYIVPGSLLEETVNQSK